MSNSDRLLSQWGNPLFITAPQGSRDLYFFCATASPPAAPIGLIWYHGDKTLGGLARKAQVSFAKHLPPLEALSLAQHDPQAGLIYLKSCLESSLIRAYTARNVSSWKKRLAAMPESPLKEEWREDLIRAAGNYPKNISAKIYQLFANSDEIGELERGSKASSPDALEVVRHFADRFAEQGHGTYIANWSREVQVAKELLMSIGVEDIKIRIDLYFKDEWLCNQASLDFMSFRRNINKFAKTAKSMPSKSDLSGYWDIVNKGAV